MNEGILNYRGSRYLWVALGLVALCTALYASQYGNLRQPPNGGTWQGYTLGGIATLLILWLSLLGVRKRRYRAGSGSVQGWTSAHVYLGASVLFVASLHSVLQFGYNVHTLAYLLMLGVVLSGVFGACAYVIVPQARVRNGAGSDAVVWARELAELDGHIRSLATGGDAALQQRVDSALELTRFAVGTWDTLLARDRSKMRGEDGRVIANRDQQAIIDSLTRAIPGASRRREAGLLTELLDACGRRQVLLRRLRRDARLRGLLRIWLFLHVPLSVALLAALLVHITSVFLYW